MKNPIKTGADLKLIWATMADEILDRLLFFEAEHVIRTARINEIKHKK